MLSHDTESSQVQVFSRSNIDRGVLFLLAVEILHSISSLIVLNNARPLGIVVQLMFQLHTVPSVHGSQSTKFRNTFESAA